MLSLRLRHFSRLQCVAKRAVAATAPCRCSSMLAVPDGQERPLSPKISQLVGDISQLSLLEVSELSAALKKALNLPDAAPMAMMAAQAAPEADEPEEPKKVQTSFTVKLLKFDETKKVALIKEIKNLLEGMNLVQAKKFVESAPAVVKADIGREEADKLAEALGKVGAACEVQ